MGGIDATVYRRPEGAAWGSVASIVGDGAGWLRFVDEDVRPGARYGYHLGVRGGASEEFHGETWITVPSDWTLALATPTPNPVAGRLAIEFTLPTAAAARLEVIDIAGRRVGDREVGALGPGSHSVTFAEASSWRPGIYLVRLTQGPRSLIARACVLR